MKRALVIALAFAMVLSLAACSGGTVPSVSSAEPTSDTSAPASENSTATPTAEPKEITIGYSFANIDENNKRTLNQITAYIEEINAARDDVNVNLLYTDSQSSVDKQLADIESLIIKKPDLVFISAVDVVGSVPAAQAVKNAGIICVEDRGIEDDSITWHFRGCDEPSITKMIKDWVIAYLEANPDEVLYTGLLYGAPAQVLQLIRNEGIKELAKEMPDRVKILDEKYGNWSTQESMAIVEDWIQRYPEMNYINSASDDMALGAINALSAANKLDGFLTTSVDGTKIGCQLVEEGKLDMTVKMLPSLQMKAFIDTALKSIDGTFTEKEFNCGTSVLIPVDSTNIKEYKDAD